MATGVLFRFESLGPAEYEKVHSALGLDDDLPDGLLVHTAGAARDGFQIFDVWESAEKFDAFVQGRVMPAMQEVGLEGRPDVDVYDLHNVWAPRAEELGRLGAEVMPA